MFPFSSALNSTNASRFAASTTGAFALANGAARLLFPNNNPQNTTWFGKDNSHTLNISIPRRHCQKFGSVIG